jgi:MarR family transcriptional regulator for hemolysin
VTALAALALPDCTPDDDDSELLAARVLTLAQLLRSCLAARLAEHDASLPSWALLCALDKDEQVSQRQLADRCGLEGPTITRHLDRLEARGLVRRERDRRDRRIVRVSFTPEGKRYYGRLERIAEDVDDILRSSLTEDETSSLAQAIGRLSTAF